MFKFHLNILHRSLEMAFFVFLAITCVYNYLNAPKFICLIIECNDSLATIVRCMFPQILAIACLLSRFTMVYKSTNAFIKYKKKIKDYELYFPVNILKKKNHRLFSVTIVFAYIVFILPINVLKLYLIYLKLDDTSLIIFFLLMYIQNLSICLVEMYFMVRCFGLYQKFQLINEEMATLKLETINANRYPIVLHSDELSAAFVGTRSNDHLLYSENNLYQFSNYIELLRMRHQFVRSTFSDLNDMYGFQLGLSLLLLFLLALSDIYGEMFRKRSKIKTNVLIYGWLLQYSFRFCAIIITTHFTTKQVSRIFNLIT